jgi:hypothetical protein
LPFWICNHTFCRSHTQSETPSSLSLSFPVLGDSCPTRAEAGQAGIGILPARRYCSPSQRLPPSGLILIYSTRLHPSSISARHALHSLSPLPLHVYCQALQRTGRSERHQIGFEVNLGIAILCYSKRKKAFTRPSNPSTYVYIPTLLPSLNPLLRRDNQTLSPAQPGRDPETLHVN